MSRNFTASDFQGATAGTDVFNTRSYEDRFNIPIESTDFDIDFSEVSNDPNAIARQLSTNIDNAAAASRILKKGNATQSEASLITQKTSRAIHRAQPKVTFKELYNASKNSQSKKRKSDRSNTALDNDASEEVDQKTIQQQQLSSTKNTIKIPPLEKAKGFYYNLVEINKKLQSFVKVLRENFDKNILVDLIDELKKNVFDDVVYTKAVYKILKLRKLGITPELVGVMRTISDINTILSAYLKNHVPNKNNLTYHNIEKKRLKGMVYMEDPFIMADKLIDIYYDDQITENYFNILTDIYSDWISTDKPGHQIALFSKSNEQDKTKLRSYSELKEIYQLDDDGNNEFILNEDYIANTSNYKAPINDNLPDNVLNAANVDSRVWSEQDVRIINGPYVQGLPNDEYELPSNENTIKNVVNHTENAVNYSLDPLTRSIIITMNTQNAMTIILERIQNHQRRVIENNSTPRQIIYGEFGFDEYPIPDFNNLDQIVIHNYLNSRVFEETVNKFYEEYDINSFVDTNRYYTYYERYFQGQSLIVNNINNNNSIEKLLTLLQIDPNMSATILKSFLEGGDMGQVMSYSNVMSTIMPDHYQCIVNSFPDYGSKNNSVNSYYFNPCFYEALDTVLKGDDYDLTFEKNQSEKTQLFKKFNTSNFNNVQLPFRDYVKAISNQGESVFLHYELLGYKDCIKNWKRRSDIYIEKANQLYDLIAETVSLKTSYDQYGKGKLLGSLDQQNVMYGLINDPAFTCIWFHKKNGVNLFEYLLEKFNYDHNEFLNRIGSATFEYWNYRNFSGSVSRYHDVPSSLKLPYLVISALSENKALEYFKQTDIIKDLEEGYFKNMIALLKPAYVDDISKKNLKAINYAATYLFTRPMNNYFMNYFINNPSFIHLMRNINSNIIELEPNYNPAKPKYNTMKYYISPSKYQDFLLLKSTDEMNDEELDTIDVQYLASGIKIAPFSSTNAQVMIEDRSVCLLHESSEPNVYAITDTYSVLNEIVRGNLAFLPIKLSINSNFFYDKYHFDYVNDKNSNTSKLTYIIDKVRYNPKSLHDYRLGQYFEATSLPNIDLLQFKDDTGRDANFDKLIETFKERNIEFKTKAQLLGNLQRNSEIAVKILANLENASSKQAYDDLKIKYDALNMTNQQLVEEIRKIEATTLQLNQEIESTIKDKIIENKEAIQEYNQEVANRINELNTSIVNTLEISSTMNPENRKISLQSALEKCISRVTEIGGVFNIVVNMVNRIKSEKTILEQNTHSQWSITALKILQQIKGEFIQNNVNMDTTKDLVDTIEKMLENDGMKIRIKNYPQLMEQIKDIKNLIKKQQDDYSNTITENDKKVVELEKQVNLKKEEIAKLNNTLKSERKILSDLQKEFSDMALKHAEAISTLEETNANNLFKAQDDYQKSIDSLKNSFKLEKEQLSKEYTDKLNKLQSQLEDKIKKIENNENTIEDLKKELRNKLASKDNDIQKKISEIDSLKQDLRKLNDELLEKERKYQEALSKSESFEKRLETSLNSIKELNSKYETSRQLAISKEEEIKILTKEKEKGKSNAINMIKDIYQGAIVTIDNMEYLYTSINQNSLQQIQATIQLFGIDVDKDLPGYLNFISKLDKLPPVEAYISNNIKVISQINQEKELLSSTLKSIENNFNEIISSMYNNLEDETAKSIYGLIKQAFNNNNILNVLNYTKESKQAFIEAQRTLIVKISELLKEAQRRGESASINHLNDQLKTNIENYNKVVSENQNLQSQLELAKNNHAVLNSSYEEIQQKYVEASELLKLYQEKAETLDKLNLYFSTVDPIEQEKLANDNEFIDKLKDYKQIMSEITKQKVLLNQQKAFITDYEKTIAIYKEKLDKAVKDEVNLIDQKEALENQILQLQFELKNANDQANHKLIQEKNREKTELLNKIYELNDKITESNEKYNRLEEKYNMYVVRRDEKEITAEEVVKHIKELEFKLNTVTEELNVSKNNNDTISKAKDELETKLEEQVKQLKSQIEILKANDNSKQKKTLESEEIIRLKNLLSEKELELQNVKKNNLDLNQKIEELTKDINNLETAKMELEEKKKKLDQQIQSLGELNTKSLTTIEDLEKAMKAIKEKITEKARELNAKKVLNESKNLEGVELVDKISSAMVESIKRLNNRLTQIRNKHGEEIIKMNDIESVLDTKKEEADKLQQEINRLNEANELLNKKIESLTEENLNQAENITKLEEFKRETLKFIEQLNNELYELHMLIENNNITKQDLMNRMQNTSDIIIELQTTRKLLEQKLQETMDYDDTSEAESKIDEIEKEIDKIKEEELNYEASQAEDQEQIRQLTEENNNLKLQIEQLNLQLKSKDTKITELQFKVATMESTIDALEDNIKNMKIDEQFLLGQGKIVMNANEYNTLLLLKEKLEEELADLKAKYDESKESINIIQEQAVEITNHNLNTIPPVTNNNDVIDVDIKDADYNYDPSQLVYKTDNDPPSPTPQPQQTTQQSSGWGWTSGFNFGGIATTLGGVVNNISSNINNISNNISSNINNLVNNTGGGDGGGNPQPTTTPMDTSDDNNPGFGHPLTTKKVKGFVPKALAKSGIQNKKPKIASSGSSSSGGSVPQPQPSSSSVSSSGTSPTSLDNLLSNLKFNIKDGKLTAIMPSGKETTILDSKCYIEVDCDTKCKYQGEYITTLRRKYIPKKKIWCCNECKHRGSTVGCCSK